MQARQHYELIWPANENPGKLHQPGSTAPPLQCCIDAKWRGIAAVVQLRL